MSKLKDVATEADVPGVGEVNMLSPYSIGALFVGTAGLIGIYTGAEALVSKIKSSNIDEHMPEV